MGPTASGKSDLALAIVERFPCEIVSVDSALVYKGMDIGTAKPSPDVRARVPHHLVDIRAPDQPYSAADFRKDASAAVAEIIAAGRVPLLVGGTMLYFRALQQGLAALPSADPAIRQRLEQEAASIGWPALHGRLQQVDAVAAARIHPNDPQRIQRALEVYELTGESLSSLMNQNQAPAFPWSVAKFVVAPSDRAWLHERIAARFYAMLEQGLVDEVLQLRASGRYRADMPSMRSVGYRQVWQYLDGRLSYNEMIDKAIVATRQLAKRQFTWLRKEADANWFDCQDNKVLDQVLKSCGNVLI
jgi:tRNA dimethylallyltransferase